MPAAAECIRKRLPWPRRFGLLQGLRLVGHPTSLIGSPNWTLQKTQATSPRTSTQERARTLSLHCEAFSVKSAVRDELATLRRRQVWLLGMTLLTVNV
jgi:hypothetical protein